MTIKLIGIDLDGTLLTSNQTISDETVEALAAARQDGLKVVLTSGRPFTGIRPFLERLHLKGEDEYVITFNGGVVQDLSQHILSENMLKYADLMRLQRLADQWKIHFHFETVERFYTLTPDLDLNTITESFLVHMPISFRRATEIKFDSQFVKGMFTASVAEIDRMFAFMQQHYGTQYAISQSAPDLIEVNARTATKGNALLQLTKELRVKSDEVMIFGDEKNDLSMFNEPNFYKVAMGNAISEIKAKADFITRTNNQDGISFALRKLL